MNDSYGIIQVGDHQFILPPLPSKKEILFNNLPKEEQYWKRNEILKDFPDNFFDWTSDVEMDAEHTIRRGKRLISLSVEDTKKVIDLRERELLRRINGVWFFNDGEPTFITGDHYFSLMWAKKVNVDNFVEPNSDYGVYTQFQRDFFYFYMICENTHYARGGIVVKPKKTAVTNAVCDIILNRATLYKQKLMRIMSTSEKEAKETAFMYIGFALEGMPTIMVPSIAQWNMGKIHFGMDEKKASKAATKKRETNLEFFNTTMTTIPTKDDAFDKLTNYIAWADEFTKIIQEASPKLILEKSIDTVIQGFKRKGTLIFTNYTQETNDSSFYEGRQIWKDSALSTIDPETGMTKSKLIRYCMLVQHGIFGDIRNGVMIGIDKYGKPILKDIWAKIEHDLNQIKNEPAKIQAYKRRMPTSEADPWMESGGGTAVFDNVRLDFQLQELEKAESISDPDYMEFNLKFENYPEYNNITNQWKFKSKILLNPVTYKQKLEGIKGLWKWFDKQYTPEWFLEKHINNLEIDKKTKLLKPRLENPFCISLDPTDYAMSTEVLQGSQNYMGIFIMPNAELNGYFGNTAYTNKRLIAEYHYRQQKVNDTVDDVIKTVLYFGCYILIECNMKWVINKLIEKGLGNFCLMVGEEGVLEPYDPNRKQTYFTTQKDSIRDYLGAGTNHLGEPINGETDNIKYLKSIIVIKQLMLLNPMDTKKYDAAMGYLIGLYFIEWFTGYKRRELEKRNRKYIPTLRAMGDRLLK